MAYPVRLQLSRRAGFNLQALSQATNGLSAVMVARRSRWGNPFLVSEHGQQGAVDRFRTYLESVVCEPSVRAAIEDLRGKNLACWCKTGAPCHADVLLELANGPQCEEVA